MAADKCRIKRVPGDGSVDTPRGELVLRTLTMPADTNPNGDIFGGWLLAQMDLAGGMAARSFAGCRVATVGIDAMTFRRPVFVGDALCCYADVERVGNTSVTIRVQAWVIRGAAGDERIQVTEGLFSFVAIDPQGQPCAVRPEQRNTGSAAVSVSASASATPPATPPAARRR